jgi:selenocysteine lyase/cysteine desulfurase
MRSTPEISFTQGVAIRAQHHEIYGRDKSDSSWSEQSFSGFAILNVVPKTNMPYSSCLISYTIMFRHDFPIFTTHPDLVYLDSASSAQKPQAVIDALSRYFASDYANIHRGAYDLSMQSSLLYEKAKKAVVKKLHANSDAEIVFTYNATYAFNLIAQGLVKS